MPAFTPRAAFRLLALWALASGSTACTPSPPQATPPRAASVEQLVAAAAGEDWPTYLGDPASTQFSRLDQIRPDNVNALEVAWTYRSGDADPDDRSQVQCSPIILDGVLYGTSAGMKLFALDAASGEELWRFDPFGGDYRLFGAGVNRGLMVHGEGEQRRLFYGAGDRLWAVHASDGTPDADFGEGGSIDLHSGLPESARHLFVAANSPGVVWEAPGETAPSPDFLILGHRTAESLPAAPGTIRAFDARSGELVWTFETLPAPEEPFGDTWPPSARSHSGGVNSWAGMALDVDRGLVYIPTGSAAFDFYGGDRAGANLFANSLLALDVRTGDLRWHYQIVHHDLWDRDLPAPPNLVTVTHRGRRIDAVAQITKSGHVFLFDRDTGEPLFPVEEVEVDTDGVEGEAPWPTQPLPTRPPPFARQRLDSENLNTLTPELAQWARDQFRFLRSGEQFSPPSLEGTVILPGLDGGGEWGGAALDPNTAILYVNSSEMPWLLRLYEVQPGGSRTTADRGRRTYAAHCMSCHGLEGGGDPGAGIPDLAALADSRSESWTRRLLRQGRGRMPAYDFLAEEDVAFLMDFLYDRSEIPLPDNAKAEGGEDPVLPYSLVAYTRLANDQGYPLVEPPWGTLSAIDLNRGEILWQVPHGDFPEIDRDALRAYGLERTGTEQYGGPIVTAGGLIFIAATRDEHIHAYDRETGALLWRDRLPAGGYATPATYAVDGRQFVVVAAGGGKMGTPSSDSWVAYALPEAAAPPAD